SRQKLPIDAQSQMIWCIIRIKTCSVGSRITLEAPQGTVFPAAAQDYSITDLSTTTTSAVPRPPSVVDGGSVVSVPVNAAIAAGQHVSLAVAGVVNPPPGPFAFTLETSSDSLPVSTPTYRLAPATGVTGGALSLSPSRALATGATWKVHFDTNTRGALAAGHGVIVLAAPAGTGLPSSGGDYLVSAGGAPGAAPSELQLLAGGSTADITVPDAVADSSPVSVVVSGVTNPGAGTAPLEVSTSSQAAPVALPAVLSGAGAAARTGPVTVLSARPSSTAAGAGLVSYVLRLRTSAHGALATGPAGAAATGTITVTGPAGTRFPACPSGCSGPAYLVDGQNVADPEVSGDLSTVSLPVPADIGPSQVVTLTLNGATNPASPGPQALSVRTSADTSPVRATFTTTAPGRVSALSAHLSSSTAGAPGVAYTVRFRTGPQGALTGTSTSSVPGTVTLLAPEGTVFPNCFDFEQACFPTYVIDGHAVGAGAGALSGNGSMVTLALPEPVAAGQVVVMSIVEMTNASATGQHSLTLWTSSDPVPVRTVFALTAPAAVSAPSVVLSSRAAGASSVDYTVRFRTGSHGALPKGFGPLQGGAGAAPFGSVTLLAPSGTAFPVCFSYEQGCFPTYLIDGQEVVPGGGSVAANGSMVTLAVPKPVAAGQEVSVSIDEMANSGAPGPGSMTVWTSSDPVPVRARFALTAPAAVGSAALSLSSTAAGASGVAYHVAFTTSSSGALPPGFGAGQGGVGATTTETVFVEGPVGTNFANCTLSCPYYPTYLVDGQDAPGALFSAGGRVLSLALPAAVASSSRVALSLDGVTSSPTPGPKTLMVWTSSDPRPVPLAYSLGAPAAVSHPSLRISDSATGAVATYTVTLRTSASGALETGPDGGSASGPGEPGTITLIGPRGTVFAGCSGGCPYTVDGHGGVPAVDLSASGAAVSVVVPADVPAGSDLTLSAPGVVNSPGAGPQVLKVWTSSDHVAQSVPFELVAAGKAPKPRPRPGPVAKPRPQPQPAGAKPSVFTVLPTPASSFASVTHDLENAGVTVAALLFITFPSQLFNSTFEENYEDIKAWWEKKLRFLGKARRKLAERKREGRSERSNAWAFAVVLVVGALLGNLINPHFGADLSSLASFLAVVAAIVTGMSVAATVNIVYRRRRHGADQAHPHLKALPAGLAIAAACVLVSRLADFAPGYLYGLICGVAFSRQLAKHEKGHVIALSTVATLAVATVVWFAWVPVQGSVSHGHAGFGLVLLDDFLGSLFVSGLVGSVIGMLPLRFLPGGDLAAWHRGAWAAVFGVALFGMLQAMLRPVSHSHVGHAPIVTVIILLVLFGGGSLVFRQHFARREREKKAAEQAAGQAGEQAGQAGEAVAHAGQAVAQGEAVGHAPPPPESPAAAPAAGAHD
ncbi:MAG: FGLLP motif-containing membrane protein, partial [Acidimicrobiales bacterium]